jgi:1-acyl-sn-glycerol-3-phosphate acyltransferase
MNKLEATSPRLTGSQLLSQMLLSFIGWRIVGQFPPNDKFVVVGAPHTTNWDFFFMLLLRGATGVYLRFIGKDSLFRWPLGRVMRKLGGIPVDRRKRSNFVDQMVDLFISSDQLFVAIAPEGTRGQSHAWKTGFYYIAAGAQVPIVLVAIDYSVRQLEISPLLWPSGDINQDFILIQKFYSGRKGKYPSSQGEVRIEQS